MDHAISPTVSLRCDRPTLLNILFADYRSHQINIAPNKSDADALFFIAFFIFHIYTF